MVFGSCESSTITLSSTRRVCPLGVSNFLNTRSITSIAAAQRTEKRPPSQSVAATQLKPGSTTHTHSCIV